MASEKWSRTTDGNQIEVAYDRRGEETPGGPRKSEDDYVTLRRAQIERLLTDAGYEKEHTP